MRKSTITVLYAATMLLRQCALRTWCWNVQCSIKSITLPYTV